MNRRTKKLASVAALAAVATLALAACSSGDSSSEGSTSKGGASARASGPFDYTDARGKKIHLDTLPKTVVAQSTVAASLWDDGYHVDGVYGELTPVDGKLSYQAGSLDLDKLTVLGKTYGEFDTEKYALMDPSLLIDFTFDAKNLWYVPTEQSKQILDLAPSLAVRGAPSNVGDAIESFLDLAGELGADTKSEAVTKAKAKYEAALADITATAKSSGLKVAVMSPTKDSLYVLDSKNVPELTTLTDAGLDIIAPAKHTSDQFQLYSWEQASEFADADVILVDWRTWNSEKADVSKIATWSNLPAVKAGQVYPWYAAAPYSYKEYAKIFTELAGDLKDAKKVGTAG